MDHRLPLAAFVLFFVFANSARWPCSVSSPTKPCAGRWSEWWAGVGRKAHKNKRGDKNKSDTQATARGIRRPATKYRFLFVVGFLFRFFVVQGVTWGRQRYMRAARLWLSAPSARSDRSAAPWPRSDIGAGVNSRPS
nr:hypothetical protein [Pandoravirus belohorizontensis]